MKAFPFIFTTAWMFFVSMSLGATKVLLVGINKYPDEEFRLRAPLADVERIAGVLQTRFGFSPTSITRLLDQQATTANVVAAFKRELIEGTGPDDVAVFYFSGHGSFVMDLDGNKPSLRAEALCTFDVAGLRPETWLTEDVLHDLVSQVKARHVLLILDCCHADMGVRGGAGRPPPPKGMRRKFMPLDFTSVPLPKGTPPPEISMSKAAPDLAHHLLLAACAAEQEAAEMDDGKGGSFSLFTAALCDTLTKGPQNLSFLDLRKAMVETVEEVAGKNSDGLEKQIPQFQGGSLNVSVADFLSGRSVRVQSSTATSVQSPRPNGESQSENAGFTPQGLPATTVSHLTPGIIPGYTPSGGIALIIKTDKTRYKDGDLMSVTATADHDCYLRLYNYTAGNTVVQIFPNKFQPDHFIHAGQTVTLPGPKPRFELRMGTPFGNELIKAVACTRPFSDEESRKFADEVFHTFAPVPLQQIAVRGIEVTAPQSDVQRGEAALLYNVSP